MKLFGCFVCEFAPDPVAPPTSSSMMRLPLLSFWMPSKPARPVTFEMSSTWDGNSGVAR